MRLLLSGQDVFKPLLQIHELMDLIIDYLDYPSIICLSMSNKFHFGINSSLNSESTSSSPPSSLLILNPNLWVNLVIRYDCVGDLISKYPSLSGLEDVEAMNERERMDFSMKCREILSEHVQGKLKKYKLMKFEEKNKELCPVCGELIERGELVVVHIVEGKVAYFCEYFHWNCLDTDEMNRRKMKRCEIDYSDSNNNNFFKKQVENFFERVDEARAMRKQKLFGIVCDSCLKLQSSRYYSGLDTDSNRVDLCMECYSNTERKTDLTNIEKRKPSLLMCSKCKEPIKNAVFSCQYCHHYSVCQNCFKQLPKNNKHSSHPFTLIGCCTDTVEDPKSQASLPSDKTDITKKRKHEETNTNEEPKKKVSLLDIARNMGFDLT